MFGEYLDGVSRIVPEFMFAQQRIGIQDECET
jgi:hypothetical protein